LLKLTVTGYYRSLRHGDAIVAELDCIRVTRCLRFFRKWQHESSPIFFSEFRRMHLFIATYCEKRCNGL